MNFLFLKLCYSIEIGAYLAYKGHYFTTKDLNIRRIAKEELKHMIYIKRILNSYNKQPNLFFNILFLVVGYSIKNLCSFFPYKVLNIVASFLEIINIVNYSYMAKQFPIYNSIFLEMAKNEKEHELYFKSLVNK